MYPSVPTGCSPEQYDDRDVTTMTVVELVDDLIHQAQSFAFLEYRAMTSGDPGLIERAEWRKHRRNLVADELKRRGSSPVSEGER